MSNLKNVEGLAEQYLSDVWMSIVSEWISIGKNVCNEDFILNAYSEGFSVAHKAGVTQLKEATKRSNYSWSEGPEYTKQDHMNEGAISLAKTWLTFLEKNYGDGK